MGKLLAINRSAIEKNTPETGLLFVPEMIELFDSKDWEERYNNKRRFIFTKK